MNRREALKNIGLSAGYIAATSGNPKHPAKLHSRYKTELGSGIAFRRRSKSTGQTC